MEELTRQENDESIERLGASVRQLRHVAVDLSAALREDGAALEALGEGMGSTGNRLERARNQASHLARAASGSPLRSLSLGAVAVLTVLKLCY